MSEVKSETQVTAGQPDLKGFSVMIGIPTTRPADWSTVVSIVSTLDGLQRLGAEVRLAVVQDIPYIDIARSLVIADFLSSQCNRLLMVDSDTAWHVRDAVRLVAMTHNPSLPVVCAVAPQKQDEPRFIFDSGGEQKLDSRGLLKINGTGLAFVVVRREVIESLVKDVPMTRVSDGRGSVQLIFRNTVVDGQIHGEDWNFFADVRRAGYEVWLDPRVSLGHVGRKTYQGSLLEFVMKQAQETKAVAAGDVAA